MLYIILLRAYFSQNVRYWYDIRDILVPIFGTRCEQLVPIFHGVKFAKYEICGSTKLSLLKENRLTCACPRPFLEIFIYGEERISSAFVFCQPPPR